LSKDRAVSCAAALANLTGSHSADYARCVTAVPGSSGGTMKMQADLRSDVTVFVLTVGAPSFAECMQRLDAQDCRFTREVIENVAPMSRALQCMLDRCHTPSFVQIDEDMLL
jgi:hypothetical protein